MANNVLVAYILLLPRVREVLNFAIVHYEKHSCLLILGVAMIHVVLDLMDF